MPIYDHSYGGLEYFRVYRSWAGQEFQEYVRIGENREQARKEAEQIERALEQKYQKHVRDQVAQQDYHVREDSSIKGLRRVLVERANRAPADVFELRVNVPWHNKVKRTTISISTHGFEKAFELAIDKVCDWYELDTSSGAANAMYASSLYYEQSSDHGALLHVAHKAKAELESLTTSVFKGLRKLRVTGA